MDTRAVAATAPVPPPPQWERTRTAAPPAGRADPPGPDPAGRTQATPAAETSESTRRNPVEVVVVSHPETGAQLVRFVDAQTREVIVQLPPQQVLDIVAHLVQLLRERHRGHDH